MINTIYKNIQTELKKLSDPKTMESGKRFFKEDVLLYGVKTKLVQDIAKKYIKKLSSWNKEDIFTLCEMLWKSEYLEETFIACSFSYAQRKHFEEKDFSVFETWIEKYVHNWASCDTFCNHTVGTFIELYPTYINRLKTWTVSKNRWVKRASAVSLIIPAKKGLFLSDVFEICNTLLLDGDDMVQKGYGWLLKVTCNMHEHDVFEFILKHKHHMPRTALRYAIEKMPKELKSKAMEK